MDPKTKKKTQRAKSDNRKHEKNRNSNKVEEKRAEEDSTRGGEKQSKRLHKM
jgi:hypothetical protein